MDICFGFSKGSKIKGSSKKKKEKIDSDNASQIQPNFVKYPFDVYLMI